MTSLFPSYFCAPASCFPFLEATAASGDQGFHYRLEIFYKVCFKILFEVNFHILSCP